MDNFEQRLKLLEERFTLLERRIETLILGASISAQKKDMDADTSLRSQSWDDLQPKNQQILDIQPANTFDESVTENVKSGNWLGIIAIICFVFAAGFIIKLSVETGWLTPERQIIIAAFFGFLLIGTGFFLRTTYNYYASLLPAAGIIILYISVFSGYLFYALISFKTALMMTNLVSALCIGLYLKFRHDIYVIVATIGAYLAPIILNLNYSSFYTIYYYICCSLAFAVLSIWARSRMMAIMAAYLAILSTFVVGLALNQNIMVANGLAVHFIIFSISAYFYSVCNKKQLTENESWAFFPVLTLFYGLEYYLIDSVYPNWAPYLSLLFAALLIGLYLLTKKWFPNQQIKSQSMIYAFASLVFFHSFYLEIIPIEFKPWLFMIITLTFAFLPKGCLGKTKQKMLYIPIIMVGMIALLEYVHMLMQLFMDTFSTSIMYAAWAAIISIWIAIRRHYADIYKQEEYGILFLGAAHLLAIIALYRLTDAYGSLAVTSCWLLYAIAVLGFAYSQKDKLMAHSALLVLALSAGKALLYDASMTPTSVRILCLLFTGVVLYGAGLLMKKIAQWTN